MTATHEALGAVGLSVLMHVGWNLIARHQPKASEPLWWVLLGHLLLLGPWGLWHLAHEAPWSPVLAALLATSAMANTVYFQGLQQAYRHAPVALVYPLVRSSPLLIALWSLLLWGQTLPGLAWAGITLSVIGLLCLAATARGHEEGRALPWTLLAMLGTSVYSLSDKAATAHLPSFGAVVGYLSVGYGVAWASLAWRLRHTTGRWRPAARPHAAALLLGSLSIGLAYALVIHAMRQLPAAEVVAYTNAGIVLATLVSVAVFKERLRWRERLVAAAVIAAGLVVLGIGRVTAG